MKIAKIENNQVTEENNIAVLNNTLPQSFIDEGWKILEEIQPVLKEFEKLNAGSYDIQSDKVVKTYQAVNILSLVDYQAALIKKLSIDSFNEIESLIPAYRQKNIALGIVYSEYTKQQTIDTVEAFRTEYYRVKDLINAATTLNSAKTKYDTQNFPTVVAT